MDEEVRQLVKSWEARANRETDVFSRFIFYYFCFNAIVANISDKESDAEMISWICTNENSIQRRFSQLVNLAGNSYFSQRLETLKNLTPIQSNRRNRPARCINDIHNFTEVVGAIYYVRCNLFHGAKSPRKIRDHKLVKVCADILQKLIPAGNELW